MGENISRYVYLGSNGGEITFCIMSVLWSVLCSYNNNCWRYKAFEVLIKVHFTIGGLPILNLPVKPKMARPQHRS